MKSKAEKFIDFSFTAKEEKIPVVKKYCQEHGIDKPVLIVNISEDALPAFNKFLEDEDVLC